MRRARRQGGRSRFRRAENKNGRQDAPAGSVKPPLNGVIGRTRRGVGAATACGFVGALLKPCDASSSHARPPRAFDPKNSWPLSSGQFFLCLGRNRDAVNTEKGRPPRPKDVSAVRLKNRRKFHSYLVRRRYRGSPKGSCPFIGLTAAWGLRHALPIRRARRPEA